MLALTGVPRHYPWGSRNLIPHFLGERASTAPVAELWFGAHPSAPSGLPGPGVDLRQFIAEDPRATLGPVSSVYGDELPFLLKLIAPAAPLSMQVHPSLARAREGYDRARAAGMDAPQDYVDANHKPELLYALTEFTVLAGLREPAAALALLRDLGHPALEPVQDILEGGYTREATKSALAHVLTHVTPAAVHEITARAAELDDGTGPGWSTPMATAAGLGEVFPGDRGVVASLLLEHMVLRPGEALFIPAGAVHMYLEGFGVEIMANSDNVIRAGLTPKNVDIPELLRVIDPGQEVLRPRGKPVGEGVHGFPVPVEEFAATVADAAGGPVLVPGRGPRIVLALEHASVRGYGTDAAWTDLDRGRALFVPAAHPALEIGRGAVFHAGVAG